MFYNFKKILKEEKEEVILSPEQYLTILSSMNYRSDFVQNLAPFKNKKIIISGSLRIQSLPIKKFNDLHIEGSLMATDSQLENIDGTEIDGGFYYTNTPFQKILLEKLKQEEPSSGHLIVPIASGSLSNCYSTFVPLIFISFQLFLPSRLKSFL